MSQTPGPRIDVALLRPGLFIHLDLGWMAHPFPLGSFKITSQQQIDTIRSLGLKDVRYSPDKSDLTDPVEPQAPAVAPAAETVTPEQQAQQRLRNLLTDQRQSQQECERQFTESARAYQTISQQITKTPAEAGAQALALIGSMTEQMTGCSESAIRLLSINVGDKHALHSLNVTVLSLLLGKAMGLPSAQLDALGVAALLHDIGKQELPERVRFRNDNFSMVETKLYQEHVGHSVRLAQPMGLPPATLLAISQHHEMADGSGFPLACPGEKMLPLSHVLALINRYDGLCNPPNPVWALTPHEALSRIFAQMRGRFDKTTLNAFIRMMGIYPPGSLVQLSDQRYALVVSVNAARPLKPRVLVHNDRVPLNEALLLSLEESPQITVLRSLKPQQLPRSALEYLAPRQRMCYFFERAVDAAGTASEA